MIGFFPEPVTLASGRRSNWYANWRRVGGDMFLLDRLSDFVIEFLDDLVRDGKIAGPIDTVYGVPEGASKIGLITQYKLAKRSPGYGPGSHASAMGRGKPKEHGRPEDRFFLGMPRGRTVVIEDVTTTGGSLLSCLAQLAEANVDVVAAVGLTNRMERRDDGLSVSDAVTRLSGANGSHFHYHHMSEATAFLPLAVRHSKPQQSIVDSIKEEFAAFGCAPLKLD